MVNSSVHYIPQVGERVWVKLLEKKGIVVKEIDDSDADPDIGRKFLVRLPTHELKQFYSCEIDKLRDTERTPISGK